MLTRDQATIQCLARVSRHPRRYAPDPGPARRAHRRQRPDLGSKKQWTYGGSPITGWFIMDNPMKMDDLGEHFRKPPFKSTGFYGKIRA